MDVVATLYRPEETLRPTVGTRFRVDYLKASGATGFYRPDWVVVQKTTGGEVNWIIETNGRVWEGTTAKDEAIREWCERISAPRRRTARADLAHLDHPCPQLRKIAPCGSPPASPRTEQFPQS